MQIIGHHAAAGGETGLHVRLDLQPALDRLAGQQPGGDHHVGIARVRATGDRGDDHGAVADPAVAFHRRRLERLARRRARSRAASAEAATPGGRSVSCRPAPRGLAAAWGPPGSARSSPDRDAAPCCSADAECPGPSPRSSGTDAAPSHSVRPVRPRRRCGRFRGGRRASARRWGRSPSWRRTRATCWPPGRGRPPSSWPRPARKTRRTYRPRPRCGGFASR